tara:strand:+ start:256 stop:1005 length:750 start_codon:yes stop_codon:yes gene_type:complete
MKNKVCGLIISYDNYLHLAEINFLSIRKYWPDLNYDLYYLSNERKFSKNYEFIKNINVGTDVSWSLSLKKALINLSKNYDYVLTFIDDLILTSEVNNNLFELILDSFIKSGGNHIKLHNPKPNKPYNKFFGELTSKMPYRATTVFTIWKIDFLIEILLDNENAWDFEKNAKDRIKNSEGIFSAHDKLFKFENTVVKGKYQWIFNKIIKDLDFDKTLLPTIQYFTLYDYLKRFYLKIRNKTYMTIIRKIK